MRGRWENSLLTLRHESGKVRTPLGNLNSRPFVSQGSGRAQLLRTARLGSQVASGGSPRPLRKEAGQCGVHSPGVPGLNEPWSRSRRWHSFRWVPVPARRSGRSRRLPRFRKPSAISRSW